MELGEKSYNCYVFYVENKTFCIFAVEFKHVKKGYDPG